MAILIRGKTICPLCCQVIIDGDDIENFPAFLKQSHRLGMFSDASFHKRCFENSEGAQEAKKLYMKWQAIWDSRPLDLKSLTQIEEWGKSAFAEFIAETQRIDTLDQPHVQPSS